MKHLLLFLVFIICCTCNEQPETLIEPEPIAEDCIDDLEVFNFFAQCCLVSGLGNETWEGHGCKKVKFKTDGFIVFGAINVDNGELIFGIWPPGVHVEEFPASLPIFARSDCAFSLEFFTDCVQGFHEVTGNPLCQNPQTNYEFFVTGCPVNCNEWRN